MISKDIMKIEAFIEFASDTEGMKFHRVKTPAGQWKAVPSGQYDPQVIRAVKR